MLGRLAKSGLGASRPSLNRLVRNFGGGGHHDDHHHEVYLNLNKDALKLLSINGLPLNNGHKHNPTAYHAHDIHSELWYVKKDGYYTLDNFIWGDFHFVPYEYDKYANLPSGYMVTEDPLDNRVIYDVPLMKLIFFSTIFLMIVYVAGIKAISGETPAIRNSENYLTVSMLEENIRKQREENFRLEQELANLQAK